MGGGICNTHISDEELVFSVCSRPSASGFNLPQIENTQERKFQEVLKSKVCICCMSATAYVLIYIVLIYTVFMASHTTYTLSCRGCRGSVTQSRLTLYNPMDCSPPGSFVHGMPQARTLARIPGKNGKEWVAISFSRAIFSTLGSHLRLAHPLHRRAGSFTTEPPGKAFPLCLVF